MGTKAEAEKEGWISMAEEKKKWESEEEFVKMVAGITMLNKAALMEMSFKQKEMWERFEEKISNFFVLVF